MNQARQRVIALIICLGGSAVLAPSASASSAPRLIDCGISTYGGKVAPGLWSAGCTGGSFIVSEMKWPSGRWGGRSVTATGTRLRNTCDPSCAEKGKYIRHPGKLTISAIKTCASPLGYVRFYTRVAWIPADGSGRFSYRQRCVPASFRISLKGPGAQFGPFDEASDWKTVPDLTILSGPARKVRADAASCVLSWRKTGVVATFVKYGTLTGDPCKVGFRSAKSRWATVAHWARRASRGRSGDGEALESSQVHRRHLRGQRLRVETQPQRLRRRGLADGHRRHREGSGSAHLGPQPALRVVVELDSYFSDDSQRPR